MTVSNPSFETASTTGTPGEAADWIWTSVQAAIDWVEFNTATEHVAYQRAREDYEAGFKIPWVWDYADSTARITATGFVAADVDKVAIQRSDNTMWRLSGYSPITWSELASGWNQAWIDELIATIIGAAEFSGADTSLLTMIEQWNTCTEDYDGDTIVEYDGPGWLYSEIDLKRQDNAVFQGMGAAYTGWKGWYDDAISTAYFPLVYESWAEAWGTSPLDGSVSWISDRAPSGRLKGKAVSFPLVIRPSQNLLQFFHDSTSSVYEIEIPAGTYATSTALAAALQVELGLVLPVTPLEWAAWQDGTTEGVQLQWDGSTAGYEQIIFGIAEYLKGNDGRSFIGFDSFGPDGGKTDLRYPVSLLTSAPVSTLIDETFLIDGWSQINFTVVQEARFSYWHPIEYGEIAAAFDSGILTASVLDTFRVWHGGDIVWKTQYSPPDISEATFTWISLGGPTDTGPIEDFTNATVNWDEHIF